MTLTKEISPRLRALGAVVAAGLLLAACAHGQGEATRTRGKVPGRTEGPRDETRLERLKRVTAMTCSPARRQAALASGAGAFCAPWDSIPALDDPRFAPARGVGFLDPGEPLVVLELSGTARAYPVRFLLFHEIVNDVVGGRPVAVTFCALCNSGVGFDRRVGSRILEFGVSGQLRNANLVMFDRQTLSTWQQLTGRAVSGKLRGRALDLLPVQMTSFSSFKEAHPSGEVMKRPRGGRFQYGLDPYYLYDRDPYEQSVFLASPQDPNPEGASDPRLPPKWRVIGASLHEGPVAFPEPPGRGGQRVRMASLNGLHIVAFFSFGTSQPARAYRLSDAPKGWSGSLWRARLGGRDLRFAARKGGFVELGTGSRFDFFGRGYSGPLRGRQLHPVPQVTSFWFAWSHFYPRTKIAGGARISRQSD